jgi:hypothetical protein
MERIFQAQEMWPEPISQVDKPWFARPRHNFRIAGDSLGTGNPDIPLAGFIAFK